MAMSSMGALQTKPFWLHQDSWFGVMVRDVVIPRAKLFTGLLIAFQLLVAVSILSRSNFVEPALIAGAVFCFIAALISNTSGAVANLFMALIQMFLAFTQ